MFDLFFLQSFLVNTAVSFLVIVVSQKVSNQTNKFNQIIPFILFPLLYFQPDPILQSSIILLTTILSLKNKPNGSTLTLISLAIINAITTNYLQLLFLNLIVILGFIITQTKLVNRRQDKKIKLTLDGLEWGRVKNDPNKQEELLKYLPTNPKHIAILKIDETNESVDLEITYEQQI